jgi:hypothetical protein
MRDLPPKKETKLLILRSASRRQGLVGRIVKSSERRCNAASSEAKDLYKSATHSYLSHANVCMYAGNRRVNLLIDRSEKLCHVQR